MSTSFYTDISSVSYDDDDDADETGHWEGAWVRDRDPTDGRRQGFERRRQRRERDAFSGKSPALLPSESSVFDNSRRRLEVWLESVPENRPASRATSKRTTRRAKHSTPRTREKLSKTRSRTGRRKNTPASSSSLRESGRRSREKKKHYEIPTENWTREHPRARQNPGGEIRGVRRGVVFRSAGPNAMNRRSKTPYQIKTHKGPGGAQHPSSWTGTLRQPKHFVRTNRWYAREATVLRERKRVVDEKCEQLRRSVRKTREVCLRQDRVTKEIADLIREVRESMVRNVVRSAASGARHDNGTDRRIIARESKERTLENGRSSSSKSPGVANPLTDLLDAISASAFDNARQDALRRRLNASPTRAGPEDMAMRSLMHLCRSEGADELDDERMQDDEDAMDMISTMATASSVGNRDNTSSVPSLPSRGRVADDPSDWSIFDSEHVKRVAEKIAHADDDVKPPGLADMPIDEEDDLKEGVAAVDRRSVVTVGDDVLPPGLLVSVASPGDALNDLDDTSSSSTKKKSEINASSSTGAVAATTAFSRTQASYESPFLKNRALRKYASDSKHASKKSETAATRGGIVEEEFKPESFFKRPLRVRGLFFRRALRASKESPTIASLVPRAQERLKVMSPPQWGSKLSPASSPSTVMTTTPSPPPTPFSVDAPTPPIPPKRGEEIVDAIGSSSKVTGGDFKSVSSAVLCEAIARKVSPAEDRVSRESLRSFFRAFADAVNAPPVVKSDDVVEAFIESALREGAVSIDRAAFVKYLQNMFGGLRSAIQKRQCSELAASYGIESSIPSSTTPAEQSSLDPERFISFDFLVMHMKLFSRTCDAVARLVEPAKVQGLTGRLSKSDIEAFCVRRTSACALAKLLCSEIFENEGASVTSPDSSRDDEGASKSQRKSVSDPVPLDADAWCGRYGVRFDEADNCVSVEAFARALQLDADLASSPCLLHALTWTYGVYAEDMLKGVVTAERKRQMKDSRAKETSARGSIFEDIARSQILAELNEGSTDVTSSKEGEDGSEPWISPSRLLEFCRVCLRAPRRVGGADDREDAVAQLPSMFLRLCRLGCVDQTRGVSKTMFSRAVEALFGRRSSQLEPIARACGVMG